MKIAIMQPTFNPWLGYFDLMDYVDSFVFLDTVQLNKRSWQVRNKFKFKNTEHLFSIPIKNDDANLIKDISIDPSFEFLKNKLFRSIKHNYAKLASFEEIYSIFENIMNYKTTKLSEFNINLIETLYTLLSQSNQQSAISNQQSAISNQQSAISNQQSAISNHCKKKIYKSSQMPIEVDLGKEFDLINICKYLNADTYISPLGSKTYLDDLIPEFNKQNIQVEYQYYQHPIYNQIGDSFISHLGIFDLLFNEGLENSLDIIKSGRNFKLQSLN